MIYSFEDTVSHAKLYLYQSEDIKLNYGVTDKVLFFDFYFIAWNRGEKQTIWIDEVEYVLDSNSVIPLMLSQNVVFESPENILLWKFNKEFYCILNHDKELGCAGFLFFNNHTNIIIQPDAEFVNNLERILGVFIEEFQAKDNQADMLRMLIVRLVIILTRQAKLQHLPHLSSHVDDKFDIVRQYNILVELHFKSEHKVQFYANELNKSPKTISNYFLQYSSKSPQKIIHDRIITESIRLLTYTDKSVKEIAFELGFEYVDHFSKFFKNNTEKNPSDYKKLTA